VEAGRVVDASQEGVLADESPQLRIEVPRLSEEEVGFSVVEVSCEGEAVLGGLELLWEAEVAPGILGNP
jgi:hypothetical protein